MTKSAFLPYANELDLDTSLQTLRNALEGADDGELFFERSSSESISFDDGRVRNASYDSAAGFGLRAVCQEAVGYAHSSDLTHGALNRAAQTVGLAIREQVDRIAPPPEPTNRRLYTEKNPIAEQSFAVKLDVLRQIDSFAREADAKVVQVSAVIAASHQDVTILRPEGGVFCDQRPMVRLSVSVIVERNGRRESASASSGGRLGMETLLAPQSWQAQVHEALRVANINLDAVPAPAGKMDIVLGPGWPGILLHEAIGHGLEGDFNRKKSSVFSDLMGKRVAAQGVTVMDDGTLPDRRGSISIDDEGTRSHATTLIEDGILVGLMQDRQNARLMGVAPTGNGRRQSYAHLPMPRMTNTYLKAGVDDPRDLVADLKDGIYAVGFGGGQVDITNGKFVFSCTEAYRVINGQIGAPIKGATLIGDGASALRHIRALGNDMALDPGMGTCGKDGQWVPVGVGQPSLYISGLTIGGAA